MVDVAPKLIEEVNKAYTKELMRSNVPKMVAQRIASNSATYSDAYRYAKVIGNARAKAFKNVINSEALPDGKMYFNIANRLIKETLTADYEDISNISAQIQGNINKRSKISLKAVQGEVDDDRLMGIINRISSEDLFDDIAWILENPVREFCASAVDSTIKENAEFQDYAGIEVVVTRIGGANCCEWCQDLCGSYAYPNVPSEVFQRHDRCTCELEYDGRKLSAYTSRAGKANTFR